MWVPPEDPFIEDGPVIHVKESVEVKLECVARGGKPPAKVSDIFQMINGTNETIFGYFQILCTMHSVAKVPFFVQKYKFLKSLKNCQFYFCAKIDYFSGEKSKYYLNFRAKIGQKLSSHAFNLAILGQNRNYWPKNSNI